MKFIFKIIMPILTILVHVTACSVNVVTDNRSPETTTESLSVSPVPDDVDMYTPNAESLYQGEILYGGTPILQLMGGDIYKVIEVLGEPLDITSRPPSTDMAGIYVYDRLYFHVDDNTPIGYITMLPDVCEIDGVSLDKNRDELISILGVPESEQFDDEGEFSNYLLLDFEIQGCLVRFCLEDPDKKASWMEVYGSYSNPPAATDESHFSGETAVPTEDAGTNSPTTRNSPMFTPIVPNQNYIGEWYSDKDNLDCLTILEINDDTITFEMSLIRLTVMWATAIIENNEIKFGENILSDYDGPALNGTLEFYEGGISVAINESEVEYIEAGTIYNFTVKTENFTYPELEALKLVKNYIESGNDSIFEPLNASYPLTYKFKDSNYMIQYDSKMHNQRHLIHQYEIVIDDSVTGEGHTSTSNWYQVDILTGEIISMFNEDGSLNENY